MMIHFGMGIKVLNKKRLRKLRRDLSICGDLLRVLDYDRREEGNR